MAGAKLKTKDVPFDDGAIRIRELRLTEREEFPEFVKSCDVKVRVSQSSLWLASKAVIAGEMAGKSREDLDAEFSPEAIAQIGAEILKLSDMVREGETDEGKGSAPTT